ncbi:MAG: hypothetical protein AAGA30_12695, partial [Planctomycetota bacterium]
FIADPNVVFEQTVKFLRLSEFQKSTFERINAAHDHRFKGLSNFILNPPSPLRPAINAIRHVARRSKVKWVDRAKSWLRKPTSRTSLTPQFKEKLNDFFCEQIIETGDLLNRDLRFWIEDCANRSKVEVTGTN